MMFSRIISISVYTLSALFAGTAALAKEYKGQSSGSNNTTSVTSAVIPNPQCNNPTSQATLEINNVRALYLNGGDMFWDVLGSRLPRYEIPKTTEPGQIPKNAIFAASIWIGGRERVPSGSPNLVVQAQTYRQGIQTYWPGPLDAAKGLLNEAMITRNQCSGWDHHWTVTRREVLDFINNYPYSSIEEISDNIRYWPARGNENADDRPGYGGIGVPSQNLARFYDVNNDNLYDPLDGDYPLLPGTYSDTGRYAFASNGCSRCADIELNPGGGADQVVWWVANDVGATKRYRVPNPASALTPIGLEIQYEAFGYSASDPTNDMTFLRQLIINKGNLIIDSCYFGQWTDPDLGNYNDDYIGCDVRRGLAICYNGDDFDEGAQGYGYNPPSVAVDFFYGPFADANDGIDNNKNGEIDEECEAIIMSNFMYFNNTGTGIPDFSTDPDSPLEYYGFLRSIWKNGNPLRHDFDGGFSVDPQFTITKCAFPSRSDPLGSCCGFTGAPCGSAAQSWDEASAGRPPGDRRFLISAGPFTLTPGMVNEVTIGIVWAKATSGGSRGSFGLLLKADDLAQRRFDDCFSRLVGPFIPNLEIAELDGELVFNIIPDTISRNPLMTTETYTEKSRFIDGQLNTDGSFADPFYRFQGYKVYQLANDKVTAGQLNNPDLARLLEFDVNGDGSNDITGVMDKIDNVTEIRNLEFNEDLGQEIPVIKVRGNNTGIFRSFKVRKDMFNPERPSLTNFKKYYYLVLPYAYNSWDENPEPYLQGNIEYKVFTATPHKSNPEIFGTRLNTAFGESVSVKQLSGIGTGGNSLNVIESIANSIATQGAVSPLIYEENRSPINIKIYNPKAVQNGDFRLRLSSRLVAKVPAGASVNPNTFFQPGDVLTALNNTTVPRRVLSSPTFIGQNLVVRRNLSLPEGPGVAVVNRVVSSNAGTFVLDVDLVNECDSGTFVYHYDAIDPGRNHFVASTDTGLTFTSNRDSNIQFVTTTWVKYDFWKLTEVNTNQVFYSEQPISENTEQLIPRYGISVRLNKGRTPGVLNFKELEEQNKVSNGFIGGTLQYDDQDKAGIGFVSNAEYQWIRRDNGFNNEYFQYSIDLNRSLTNYIRGSWAPYICAKVAGSGPPSPTNDNSAANDGGPGYKRTGNAQLWYTAPNAAWQSLRQLARTQNVDIVITADKSKWTRCVVLQNDTVRANGQIDVLSPMFSMIKRRNKFSVDKDGNPDNSKSNFIDPSGYQYDSKGMGWFPGYAIDLNRGIRLNMMFSESELADPVNGNNLKFEPLPSLIDRSGGKSFIYVCNTAYDEGKKIEETFDRLWYKRVLAPNPRPISNNNIFGDSVYNFLYNTVMWTGVPSGILAFTSVPSIRPLLGSDVKISLRINRDFEGYAIEDGRRVCKAPEYEFNTSGVNTERFVTEKAKSALDLIRVVPNPYYAYSVYENSQVDNRVKITNLPTKCVVTIYTLNGTLVRQFKIDQTNVQRYVTVSNGRQVQRDDGFNEVTWQDWDLKNQLGFPIASGVYIIHIDAYNLGQKVVKWFGSMRPTDLDSF
jgi:hypothetical protein